MTSTTAVESGRVLAEFWVSGHPRPFDNELEIIPEAERRPGKDGRIRFARPKPNPLVRRWRESVGQEARRAMNGRAPVTGPVVLRFDFFSKARGGELNGSPWVTEVRVKPDGRVSKSDPFVPDADNLAKSAKDAMNGIVYLDDSQVWDLRSRKCFGPEAGLKVTAWAR